MVVSSQPVLPSILAATPSCIDGHRILKSRGPLTRCLEEEDDKLCDDADYVPSNSTIRVKVFLPNGFPLFVVLKSDATVQDAIEKTIRKSNALLLRFQRKMKELKEARQRQLAEKLSRSPVETDAKSPSDAPEPSRRPLGSESFATLRSEEFAGSRAMALLSDGMAYELRMEIADGECDMDVPGTLLFFLRNSAGARWRAEELSRRRGAELLPGVGPRLPAAQ